MASVDILSAKCAYVDSAYPTTNYGSETTIQTGLSKTREGLAEWNLSAIPSNATITSALIRICNNKTWDATVTLRMYRVTASWVEGSVTWNTKPAHNATVWGTYVLPDEGYGYHYYSQTVTTLVQNWFSGAWSNYGVKWTQYDAGAGYNRFWADDGAAAPYAPKLIVTYTLPPEPASFVPRVAMF